jgi:hypothetical protein
VTLRKTRALWTGWGGTTLFLTCWLAVSWISSLSFLLWIGLMCLCAIMCFCGGIYRSRWFLLPGFAAVVITVGVVMAAVSHER